MFGGRPRIIRVPLHKSYDFEEDVPRFVDDMDIRRWFPYGADQICMRRLPGADNTLLTHYTVFWAKNPDAVVANGCVSGLGLGPISGNVLVVRHGRRMEAAVAHISSIERTLVDILLARFALHIPPRIDSPLTAHQVASAP